MTVAHYFQIAFDLITGSVSIIATWLLVPQLITYAVYRLTKSFPVALVVAPATLAAILELRFDGGLYLSQGVEGGVRWSLFLNLICINLFATAVIVGPLRSVWRLHQSLPRYLRVTWLVPISVGIVVLSSHLFELPPGPLCDEGMVLFMEGGCDYGVSNIFFHSKIGLLVSLNIAFVVGWMRKSKTGASGFASHFLVAGCLVFANLSGGYCDTYYANPNGSIGEMVLEVAAFAALGIVLMQRWSGSSFGMLLLALLGWNLFHVGVFYFWLLVFNHWTWIHTLTIVATLAATAYVLRRRSHPNEFMARSC